MGRPPLLSVRDLDLAFPTPRGPAHALRGVDLVVGAGEIHALVGESGSGKTVTARTILGLLPRASVVRHRGSILFEGRELAGASEEQMRAVRGRRIGIVFQEPGRYLNPAYRIREQIGEMTRLHLGLDREQALERSRSLLTRVGLGADEETRERVLRSYPHELSGGMKQRAMIAMAISCGPSLLIADEPTTALDVTVQRQILGLILELNRTLGMAVLFISHDLGIVHELSDVVSVIYAGRIVETAPRDALFERPEHPYTRLLLASIPDPDKRGRRLRSIPGKVPDVEHIPPGCSFHPRCPFAEPVCALEVPALDPARSVDQERFVACHLAASGRLPAGGAL